MPKIRSYLVLFLEGIEAVCVAHFDSRNNDNGLYPGHT
jgi:hypothetical protein